MKMDFRYLLPLVLLAGCASKPAHDENDPYRGSDRSVSVDSGQNERMPASAPGAKAACKKTKGKKNCKSE